MQSTLTTPLKKRLKAAFEERTKKSISEVGMIVTEVKQKPYTKNQYRNTLTQN